LLALASLLFTYFPESKTINFTLKIFSKMFVADFFLRNIFFILYKSKIYMSKERNQIIGIELEVLQDLIRVAVRNEMETSISESRFGSEFMDEVWDRKKVADFLHITPEKVSTGVINKELPGKKIGREYFFLKSEIVRSLKRRN